LQNHDQVANSPGGKRLSALTTAGKYRALTAVLLLGPGTPMLFQGQEWGATTPFHYFVNHEDLAQIIREGRYREMQRFAWFTPDEQPELFPDPCVVATMRQCILDRTFDQSNQQSLALHRDLLRLRKTDRVFAAQDDNRLFGAVLGGQSFLLRYFGDFDQDRLILVNLGGHWHSHPLAEPLLAAPPGQEWHMIWSSDATKYGGSGAAKWDPMEGILPAEVALVFIARPEEGNSIDTPV
jgi:maltooligosyltrehalose trehalohydrolase